MATKMVRKLALALALLGLVALPPAHGLGLGQITLRSALNEPLDADINLLSGGVDDTSMVKVKLATPEAFQRAGLDRPFVLTKLRFRVVEAGDGGLRVEVTSEDPIREPFLNFLVEVNWPNGRLVRQYTVLLDPPTFMPGSPGGATRMAEAAQGSVSPVQPEPSSASATPPAAEREAAPQGGQRPADTPQGPADTPSRWTPPAQPGAPSGPRSYRTQANDTLWSLAERFRPEGVSIEQMMLALFRANPNAFYEDNINALERGRILRVPEREALTELTQGEAVAQVRRHHQMWRDYRRRLADRAGEQPPKLARADAAGAAADGQSEPPGAGGQLEVIAPSEGQSLGTGGGDEEAPLDGAQGAEALREELVLAQEELEAERAQNEELSSRVGELQSQMQNMQRLLALKDDELAALQQQLSEADAGDAAAADEAPGESAEEAAPAPEGDAAEKRASDAPDAAGPADPAQPQTDAVAGAAEASEEAGAGTEESEADAATQVAEAEQVGNAYADEGFQRVEESDVAAAPGEEEGGAASPDDETPSGPAEPDSAAAEQTPQGPMAWLDTALATARGVVDSARSRVRVPTDPQTMGLGGAAAILLLTLAWLMVRRRRMQSEGFQESILQERGASQTHSQTSGQGQPSSGQEESSFLSDFAVSDIGAIQSDMGEADPLAEADVYLAYGRYQQAEELLRDAIRDQGQRVELQAKLLEVYHAAGERERFVETAEALHKAVGDADPMWDRALELGREVAPGHPLFGGDGQAGGGASEADLGDLGDLGEFDLGDLEGGGEPAAEPHGTGPAGGTAERYAAPGGDLGAGLELGTGGEPSESEAGGTAKAAGGETDTGPLEFDLSGLDLGGGGGESSDATGHGAGGAADDAGSADNSLDFDLSGLDLAGVEGGDAEETPGDRAAAGGSGFELDEGAELSGETDWAYGAGTGQGAGGAGELEGGSELDEVGTKLDLARAYIDMGDQEGARSILEEVLEEGNADQQREAQELQRRIS